ncbi:MAG TPA: hypothetical protein VH062_28525 [Polyangiaceae bacterium]|nr:hypothetical protein [Polyangiaceae bacterium]
MIAVIFELWPHADTKQTYLGTRGGPDGASPGRVAMVLRDYGLVEPAEGPADSREAHG